MEENNSSSPVTKIIIGIIAVLVCCACLVILGAAGFLYTRSSSSSPLDLTPLLPQIETDAPPQPTVELTQPPIESIPPDTLETLLASNVPENDPYELACRLEKKCNSARTIPAKQYKVGDRETFWILNSDTVQHTQYEFTLLYITPHTYFWVQEGVRADKADVKKLMDTFENEIYPTNREFFGSEFIPGVDEDPHIYVLYATGLGTNIGGYFNSSDSYHPDVNEYSNAHETYVMSDSTPVDDRYAYGTLAHEFVHMIQFPTDRNDASWMAEGFAEVGVLLNGYYDGGADYFYVQDPDLQLNTWADNSSPDFSAHYGQSFLYLAYYLDRYGKEATKALNANPENDLQSIDDTLKDLNIVDSQTGQVPTADDVFMDWAAALYLRDKSVGDGRYTYYNYPNAPQTEATEVIKNCPSDALDRTINQYGIDYIKIDCTGDHTLRFSGSTVASLLPADAYSGAYAFWSNKGNESDMTLTREFDFSGVSGSITLSYQTWYDIEEDWDYVYLSASTDGQNWEIIQTPSSTDSDPSGNSYGWGYTGKTDGWQLEEVDLSQFAGQKVQLRFEYVTDAAVNGEGLLLDDIRIDAINYTADLEADNGGWDAQGFVRVQNILPQTYRLSLIIQGATTTVTPVELNPDNTAEISLSLKDGETATLIVTGTTRFTVSPAAYRIEVK